MACCYPVLHVLGFLLLFSYGMCQALVSIQLNYGRIIYFDNNHFQKFQECLCGANIRKCTAESDRKEHNGNLYDVTNIERDMTSAPDVYSHNYRCTSYRHVHTTSIVCNRIFNIDVEDQSDSYRSCQNVPVYKLHVFCSPGCLDILWEDSQSNITITNINKDTEILGCGLCQTETSTTPKKTITITKAPTKQSTPTFNRRKNDDPNEDNLPLIVGVVVAVIVILIITGLIIALIWWRRKRNPKPPSTSQHYYTAVKPNSQAVVDSYVSAEEVIQKKRAAAAKNSDTNNKGTEYSSIDEDVTYTVPDNGLHNPYNNNGSLPDVSLTTPASTTYSRLGQPVRIIQNPYDALQNLDEYLVAKFTPANSQTSVQYSLTGPATSHSSTQDSETVRNSTPSSQPTNINGYGYEEVDVNSMTTRPGVSINHYENTPGHVYGDSKEGR